MLPFFFSFWYNLYDREDGDSVKNNRGQALVEFILILPVFLMILFVVIDFGMIFNKKSNLEGISNDIVELYKNNKSISEIQNIYKDIKIEIMKENDYTKLIIVDDVDLVTPGMNLVFDDPYIITIERVVPYA